MEPANQPIYAIDPRQTETWERQWFLSFDLDWAADAVLADTLDLLSSYDVRSTFLITHDTPMLKEMRTHPCVDLGIHPNFNPLLEGHTCESGGAKEVLSHLLEIVPEARCVRSHSLAQSSRIHDLFALMGLTHDLNTLVPSGSYNDVMPWPDWNGTVRVPYVWEDDVFLLYKDSEHPELAPESIARSEMKFAVMNFHPIHVFLNTESIDRYERTRALHRDPKRLAEHRFRGYGTRNQLIDLLESGTK